jgi:hypothetical protein
MENIRQKLFESNSSSTHSVVIDSSSEVYRSITPDDKGEITLDGGRFGWEWRKYSDPLTKANYCAVYAKNVVQDERLISRLIGLIKSHTGASHVNIVIDDDSDIDHQSHDTAKDVFASDDSLKNFIFGRDSILYTGNDNNDSPPNFYGKAGAKYTHILKLQGTDDVYKLEKDNPSQDEILDILSNLWPNNMHYDHFYYKRGENTFGDKIKVEKRKPNYDKNGEFVNYTILDTRFLKFEILPI